MAASCIGIIASALIHVLPTPTMTLSWTHSVENTRWEEDYRARAGTLEIREARVTTSGAGMDPPAGAVWSDGWWRYAPALEPLAEVVLANSEFVAGYTVCWAGAACRPLRSLAPAGQPVKLVARPCGATRATQR